MRTPILFFTCCLLLMLPQILAAQCCSPGNPIGGQVNPGTNPTGRGQVLLSYRYGYAGQYYAGTEAIRSPAIRSGDYMHIGLMGTYGLSERLTVEVETGYVLYKRQIFQSGIRPAELGSQGLTDLYLLARWNLWRDLARGWEITAGLGPKFPLGNYQQTVDGVRLLPDLQPTTGATELIQTLFVQKAFLAQRWRLFWLSRLELKGQNPDAYRYGPLWAMSSFASYTPDPRWTLITQLRYEWRGWDSRPFSGNGVNLGNGRERVGPTGSRKVFLSPQVAFQPNPDWQITLLGDLPLYQFYHEQQLGTTLSLMLNVGWWFGE